MPPARRQDRVRDMLMAARKIQQYTSGLSFADFANDPRTINAGVRNLSIIGEAARHIPDQVQVVAPSVPWHAIRGMRRRIIHEYAHVDAAVVWDTVTRNLPSLVPALKDLLDSNSQ